MSVCRTEPTGRGQGSLRLASEAPSSVCEEPGLCSPQAGWAVPDLQGEESGALPAASWEPAGSLQVDAGHAHLQTPDEQSQSHQHPPQNTVAMSCRAPKTQHLEEKSPSSGPSPPIHSAHSSLLQREGSSSHSDSPTSLLRALNACCASPIHAPCPRFLVRSPRPTPTSRPGHIHSALQLSYLPLPPPTRGSPLLPAGSVGGPAPV